MLPNKQRVHIFLDGAVIEHFKSKAGDRGCQTLINEALKHAIAGLRAMVEVGLVNVPARSDTAEANWTAWTER